jgi:lysozyme
MVNGIDVSDWQGTVDFSALQAADYRFSIAKSTEGTDNAQETFARNLAVSRERKIIFGAYHFLSWSDDPVAQAAAFLKAYTPTKGDLPPALDCEGDLPTDPQVAISIMATWLDYVEAHLPSGRRCLIYGDYSFFHDYLGDARSEFSGHPLWVAAYGNSSPVDLGPNVAIWQSSEGVVHGVCDGTPPDLDQFLGSSQALEAFVLP